MGGGISWLQWWPGASCVGPVNSLAPLTKDYAPPRPRTVRFLCPNSPSLPFHLRRLCWPLLILWPMKGAKEQRCIAFCDKFALSEWNGEGWIGAGRHHWPPAMRRVRFWNSLRLAHKRKIEKSNRRMSIKTAAVSGSFRPSSFSPHNLPQSFFGPRLRFNDASSDNEPRPVSVLSSFLCEQEASREVPLFKMEFKITLKK